MKKHHRDSNGKAIDLRDTKKFRRQAFISGMQALRERHAQKINNTKGE